MKKFFSITLLIAFLAAMLYPVQQIFAVNQRNNFTYAEMGKAGYLVRAGEVTDKQTALLKVSDRVGKKFYTYGSDYSVSGVAGKKYALNNLENSSYFSDETAKKIRTVVKNSYPNVSISDIQTKSGLNIASEEEAITASQIAVWKLSNGKLFHPTSQITQTDQRICALRDWYLTLSGSAPAYKVNDVDIKKEIVKDTVVVKYKSKATNADGSEIAVTASTEPATVMNKIPKDADGYYGFSVQTPPESLKVTFEWEQTVGSDVYLFSPEGGRTSSQTMVGVYSGSVPMKKSETLDCSGVYKGNLKITVKSMDGVGLAGTKFNVYTGDDPSGTPTYKDVAGNDKGEVVLSGVPITNYVVTQSQAPPKYIKDTSEKKITVFAGETATADFLNAPDIKKGNLKIYKADGKGRGLAGGVFDVYKGKTTEGQPIFQSVVSNGNGEVFLENVEVGTYSVVEKKAPDGYKKDETVKQACVKEKKTVSVTFVNIIQENNGSIKIKKTDKEGTGLAGAVFDIYVGENINGTPIYSGCVSNSFGIIIVGNVIPGKYTLVETTPPAGYKLNTAKQTVTVNKGAETLVVIPNEKEEDKGALKIKKTDSNGNGLANAHFNVYCGDTAQIVYMNLITDNNGEYLINNVKKGSYIVVEHQAPPGYNIDTESKTVTVDKETTTVLFTDTLIETKGALVINATDNNGNGLMGAMFDVYQEGTAEPIYIGLFSDVSGRVLISDLPAGVYTVAETKPPTGYTADTANQQITVVAGKTGSLTFTHKLTETKGAIKIKKTDTKGNGLAGAKFDIYFGKTTESAPIYVGLTTDADGKITVGNIPVGVYTVIETYAPEGYVLDGESQRAVVTGGNTAELTFINTLKQTHGAIKIVKTDEKNNHLAGAVFDVYQGEMLIYTGLFTDENGEILVSGLTEGGYTVVETKAPNGYVIDTNYKGVTVVGGNTSTVTFTNTLKETKGTVKIEKTDGKGKGLAGGFFDVYGGDSAEGSPIYSGLISNADGEIVVNDLNEGSYTVVETKAPSGYTIDTASKTVTVKGGETTTVAFVNTIKETKGSVEIIKTDDDNNRLSGAMFNIYEGILTTGTPIYSGLFTDENGRIFVTGVNEGFYTAKEMQAPNGYVVEDDSIIIAVTGGRVSTVTFNNKLAETKGAIKIKKTDQQNTPLAGAMFDVYGGDTVAGAPIYSGLISDGNGEVLINNLSAGKYTVKETKAPNGYAVETETQTATVTGGNVSLLTFVNFVKPVTGSIKILKTIDGTTTVLPGAEFQIAQNNTFAGTVYTVVTDENGIALQDNLAEGVWYVKETRAPEGYIAMDNDVKEITVVKNETAETTFTNGVIKGNVQLTKVDSANTGNTLSGAIFNIYSDNNQNAVYDSGDALVGTMTEAEPGIHKMTDLPYGGYFAMEKNAPNGYVLDTKPYYFNVSTNGSTEIIETKPGEGFGNDAQEGGLYILKQSEDKVVEGFSFKVSGTSFAGDRYDNIYVTDVNGEIKISAIRAGNYTVEELNNSESSRYEPNNSVNVIVLDGNVTYAGFYNRLRKDGTDTDTDVTSGDNVEDNDSDDVAVSNIKHGIAGSFEDAVRKAKIPQTADSTTLAVVITLLIFSACAVGVLVRKKK